MPYWYLSINTVSMDKESSITQAVMDIDPPKRSRGRPRKNQIINTVSKKKALMDIKSLSLKDIKKPVEEDIILHLPIWLKDVEESKRSSIFEKSTTTQKKHNKLPESVTPEYFINVNEKQQANQVNQVNQSNQSNQVNQVNQSNQANQANQSNQANQPDKNIFTINDINSDSNTDSSNYEYSNAVINELKAKLKEQSRYIKELKSKLATYENAEKSTNTMHGLISKKVLSTELKLIDNSTGTTIVAESTEIACWWCTHTFANMPYFIPEKYNQTSDRYYVFGCFCTINCAAAYALNMTDTFTWTRFALLKKMYRFVLNIDGKKYHIIPTPAREVFEKFGGTVCYDTWRENVMIGSKEYRFIMPPMTSIHPLIEESVADNYNSRSSVTLANINRNSMLKRTKPLPNTKNSLFDTLKQAEI